MPTPPDFNTSQAEKPEGESRIKHVLYRMKGLREQIACINYRLDYKTRQLMQVQEYPTPMEQAMKGVAVLESPLLDQLFESLDLIEDEIGTLHKNTTHIETI